MAFRGERRRASAGNTHDPFECCGKEAGAYGRPKGQICHDCANLITEGKAARAAAAAAKEAGQVDVFAWTEVNYGWPRFYSADCYFPHNRDANLHEQLADAFYHLVNTISQPAPADTPRESPKYEMRESHWDRGKKERRYIAWPHVIERKAGSGGDWQFHRLILMNPAARDAVDKLFQAIVAALGGVYQEGKERGGSVLLSLAKGELSLADFDDALKPAEKRRR